MILTTITRLAHRNDTAARSRRRLLRRREASGVRARLHWVVTHHPEMFDGVCPGDQRVGGYSVTLGAGGGSVVPITQTAGRGILWLRLTAHGRAGHGSV